MHARESLLQVCFKLDEGPSDCSRTRDYHIIAAGAHFGRLKRCDQGSQTSAYPVTDDGAANFLGNSKAEPRLLVRPCGTRTRPGLEDERGRAPAAAAADAKKFGTGLEGCKRHGRGSLQAGVNAPLC